MVERNKGINYERKVARNMTKYTGDKWNRAPYSGDSYIEEDIAYDVWKLLKMYQRMMGESYKKEVTMVERKMDETRAKVGIYLMVVSFLVLLLTVV